MKWIVGKWELFGQVNVRDNSTASLSLSFKDGYDDDFVELEKFYLSFFDIDQQRTENRHTESLCIDDDQFDEYLLSSTTSELQVTQQLRKCDGSYGSSTVFASSAAGFECDNPTDPFAAPRPSSQPARLERSHRKASILGPQQTIQPSFQ